MRIRLMAAISRDYVSIFVPADADLGYLDYIGTGAALGHAGLKHWFLYVIFYKGELTCCGW